MTNTLPKIRSNNPYVNHSAVGDEKSYAILDISRPSVASAIWSGFRFLLRGREKSFVANRVQAEIFARERFRALLCAPFPGVSDREIADLWAAKLNVSERTVQNWLAMTSSASITDMTIVGATHGIWQTAAIFVGDDKRDEVMARIGR